MSISVRTATIEDSQTIAGYQIAMAMETEEKTLEPGIVEPAVRAVFEDESGAKGFYVVAEVNGKIVGSLLVTFEWSDWRNSNMWYIQSVYVDAECRGQGAFKALYQHVLELAKKDNVMFVRLYVETENVKAQKAYEKLGMKRMPYYMYDVRV